MKIIPIWTRKCEYIFHHSYIIDFQTITNVQFLVGELSALP